MQNKICLKFKCKLFIVCTRQDPPKKVTTLHCVAAYAARLTSLFCMIRRSGGCLNFCSKFTLNTCPRVVFIKIQNTKRFLLSSKRHFKQIRGKSMEMIFYAKSWNFDCDITMVWQNKKIGDFTYPTKPILSCYFCQLPRYGIF